MKLLHLPDLEMREGFLIGVPVIICPSLDEPPNHMGRS